MVWEWIESDVRLRVGTKMVDAISLGTDEF